MKFVGVVLTLVVAAGAVLGVVYALAGLADGPLGMIPGGPLVGGNLVEDAYVDWDPLAGVGEIELQLESQGRSRTVWFLVYRGDAYVPCAIGFPPGKSWHRAALADGRAIVRIEGTRYRRRLVRVEDADTIESLRAVVKEKYDPSPGMARRESWFFRLE